MPGSNLSLFAKMAASWNTAAKFAQETAGNLPPTTAVVTDVNDPENKGRVKCILDECNPEILEAAGFPQGGAKSTVTDWITPNPPFTGKQASTLVGKRIKVIAANGDPNQLIFTEVIQDNLKDPKAKNPGTSTMTRLPVYPSGSLPPATKDNVGCVIVEQEGPQGYDWLMVCLKRAGGYKWVRHSDRLHYHTGQLPDNDSEGNGPDNEARTFDDIIVTTGSPKEGSD